MPPSSISAFTPFNGPLDDVVCQVGPPLSLVKTIKVSRARPALSTAPMMRPTASSSAASVAR
jgi:hypothetical protein